jgi:heat shock protein beta
MLQQHSSLKTIKKKLIRKALDMIRKLAEEDPDEYSNKDKTGNGAFLMNVSHTL